MKQIRRSAIVAYSCQQMYDVVNDVAAYPVFLPWCRSSVVLEQSPDEMLAKLELSASGMSYSFTTRNLLEVPSRIRMTLVDGMFSSLSGGWVFTALGDAGCKVEFELRFSLPGRLMAMSAGRVFSGAADKMVEAFCERADYLYG